MDNAKNPHAAAAAGVLVPGLGHLYAGDRRGAAVAFVVVTLMFGLGVAIADYRVFAFTRHPFPYTPLLAWIPIHVWPEVGNLLESAIVWVQQPEVDPIRSRLLRLPVAAEHIGLTLTGLSGALNFMLAADACWLVARDNLERRVGRKIGGRPGMSVVLGWLVPGLGHIREGRRSAGLLVGGSLLSIYLLGLFFSELRGVDRPQLYWLWAAQTGLGGPTLVFSPLLGPLLVTSDIETMDLGTTLLAIAGLMNLVVLTDVYTIAERRALASAGLLPKPDDKGALKAEAPEAEAQKTEESAP